jgi:hypothetical protein
MDEIENILNKAEELSDKISTNLKELEDLIYKNSGLPIDIKINFPQGVLRKAENIRAFLPFIKSDVLKRNLSYHLMLADFYGWFLNRFNITLTGQEMLIKEGICLYGNICAAILKDAVSKNKSVNKCIETLFNKGVIDENLKNDLEWLWEVRNKEHIEGLEEWEFRKYKIDDFNRACSIFDALFYALIKKYANE